MLLGRRGGFLQRLEQGTWMGHIAEHVALELQCLAGTIVTKGRHGPPALPVTTTGSSSTVSSTSGPRPESSPYSLCSTWHFQNNIRST
ncbi:MAG: hypothetical protein WKH64_13315 [Chloroflexia bacterium]